MNHAVCRWMRLWVWALMLAMVAMLSGCGTSPPTKLITLEPTPGQQDYRTDSGPAVTVGEVRLPPDLERDALTRRQSATALETDWAARWAAPLDELVRRTLTADLARRLPDRRVIRPEQPLPRGGARIVVVTLEMFSAGPNGDVLLEAAWSVHDSASQRVLMQRTSRAAATPASGQPADIAAAMSEALGRLADDIAAALAEADRQ